VEKKNINTQRYPKVSEVPGIDASKKEINKL
jgi:hypothetical protein